MLLIPAIDLKDGLCVRLKQGDMDQSTTFGEDPAAMARSWVDKGARRLHLVDLNGAFAGKPKNEAAIRKILIEVGSEIDVQLGGARVFIAEVTQGDGVNAPPVTPYQGLDHFGLSVKDIDAVAAEIKAKGVEFTKEPTTIRPGVRICFIRGPQGISIELLERDKKYV